MWHPCVGCSTLILASVIGINSAAIAQNVDINFSGTVPIQTTFSTPNSGSVESSSGTSPGSLSMSGSVIESVTPATVNVQTNSPTTITVYSPTFVSGPTPDPSGTNRIGFLKFGSTTVRSDVGGGKATLPVGNNSLAINMRIERPQPFVQGNYNYKVNLTITP